MLHMMRDVGGVKMPDFLGELVGADGVPAMPPAGDLGAPKPEVTSASEPRAPRRPPA